MESQVVVTATSYQHNQSGQAVATGVGLRVDSNTSTNPVFIYKTSDTHKYGALILSNILHVLQSSMNLKEKSSIRFITGMPDIAGVLRKIQKSFIRCLEQKVTSEEQVDKIVYQLSNYERRANHELYVLVVTEALILSNNGLNLDFYPNAIRTAASGDLWAETKKQTMGHKSPPL